jgi:hypothetical protein
MRRSWPSHLGAPAHQPIVRACAPHRVADVERHEIDADLKRPAIGFAGFRDDIVEARRRDVAVAQQHQVAVSRELRLRAREDRARLFGGGVVGDDALDRRYGHQLLANAGDFVDQEVGAGSVLDDVLVVARVTGDHDRMAAVLDPVPVGRLDQIAMIDLERDHPDSVLVVDDTILVEFLDGNGDPFGRQLFVGKPGADVEGEGLLQIVHEGFRTSRSENL